MRSQPAREVVRPENQLALSEKELDEELPRTLTAGNPAAPANIVRFRRATDMLQFCRAAGATHLLLNTASPSRAQQPSSPQEARERDRQRMRSCSHECRGTPVIMHFTQERNPSNPCGLHAPRRPHEQDSHSAQQGKPCAW